MAAVEVSGGNSNSKPPFPPNLQNYDCNSHRNHHWASFPRCGLCRGARKQHKKTRDFLVIDLLHEQRFNAPFITFQKGKVPFNNGDCRFVPGDCRFVLEPSGKSRVPHRGAAQTGIPCRGTFPGPGNGILQERWRWAPGRYPPPCPSRGRYIQGPTRSQWAPHRKQ